MAELARLGRRLPVMLVHRQNKRALASAVLIAASVSAPAVSQAADTFVANSTYSSDYEVETWDESERRRQTDYLQQQYMSSDELLGGPVRQPGEPAINSGQPSADPVGATYFSASETAAISSGASIRPQGPTEPKPGMSVASPAGETVGTIAVVQRSQAGKVDSVWLRRAVPAPPDLVQISMDDATVAQDRVIMRAYP